MKLSLLSQVMSILVAAVVSSAPGQAGAHDVQQTGSLEPRAQLIGRCEGFLEGVVVDRAKRLWAVNAWDLAVRDSRIVEITPDGKCVEHVRLGQFATGAKLSPDGSIMIVGAGGMLRFDPNTRDLKRIALQFEGADLLGLNDLAYDSGGGIYFTVPGGSDTMVKTGRVFHRAPSGKVALVASGLSFPNGVAVAPDGQSVSVGELANKRILSVPSIASRQPVKITYVLAYVDRGIGPDGLAYDETGHLNVANFGDGSVTRIAPGTNAKSTISLGEGAGKWSTNIAVVEGQLIVVEAAKGEIWRVTLPSQ